MRAFVLHDGRLLNGEGKKGVKRTQHAAALFAGLVLLILPTWVTAQNSLDDAVRAALTSFNARPDNPIRYRELARFSEGGGAIVFAEVYDPESEQAFPGVIDWLYGVRENGIWTFAAPGDATYQQVFRTLPDALVESVDDTSFRTAADPALAPPETLQDYQLPFPPGESGIVTRGYADHGTGKIDIDLTARDIAAVKDGHIVFARDDYDLTTFQTGAWWYWNNVIIRHSPYEYSLYGHIAADSIPDWITDACDDWTSLECAVPVRAGDVIAQEGNTGYSTNPHLHLEFGQGAGVIAYLDWLDADRDGFRNEPIYAGYVYAEHNVTFLGYTPADVMAWEYLTRLTAPGE